MLLRGYCRNPNLVMSIVVLLLGINRKFVVDAL